MATTPRLRLYQYPMSAFCIPIELALRHSGLPYEVVDLPYGDPRRVIELTKGECYQVPVVEDLFSHTLAYDKSPAGAGDDVPRFVAGAAPLMNLFPPEIQGWQHILITYIENECETTGFKVCDAFRDHWLKNDLERGLHRRHKERKFGAGCLEEWTKNVDALTEAFYAAIYPFEQMLAERHFLTGEHPVYADYALCGVLGNFLFPGNTVLPPHCLMLEAWYARMRAGNFARPLEELATASAGATGTASEKNRLLADVTDIEKAVADLKLRPGTYALDVATGNGHTALCLAAKGLHVLASDTSAELLREAAQLAEVQKLTVTFHEHPAEQLPYENGSFSLVTCRMAAHHFRGPESFVREAARVLKPYGHLVLIDGTVPDDQAEAYEWMNAVEKLHDPQHVRFITPNVWRRWCVEAGLTVSRLDVESVRQPELTFYFDETQTPPENRKKILEMLAKAPPSVRGLFKIGQEGGKIVWSWRRLTLVAGKV